MHLSTMQHTIVLLAGFAYGQVPPVLQPIDSFVSIASQDVMPISTYIASDTSSLSAVPGIIQTGLSAGATPTSSMVTSSGVMTTRATETSMPLVPSESSVSGMVTASGAANETTKSVTMSATTAATMSTTVGNASGTAASKNGNATSTTSASASPTGSKKSDAVGYVRGFPVGGAGVLLLVALFAGF